ncbi:zf-HC2 domain-containing protein [Tunturiibacter lichenicola]|uniref:zf-HC2 domain-containing protein n=1 Tax=Tunturiibacter lichenicola TaxID=2051959 RepID=UPI0021B41671|nr:zf-HC2 domain-containing protein [Edaphobacter lichenicola]
MTSQACLKCRSSFSSYLDSDVSGKQMQKIATHLESCKDCTQEFASWRAMQRSLSALGPAKAPADLGLKLRLAISHEHAKRKSNWLDTISVKWENAIRPMLVQVSAGFAGAVVLVGGIALLLGIVAAPEPVMANDEPLGAMTAPHYLYSSVPRAIVTDRDAVIVVEAYVDAQGKVYDYNLVSGPESAAVQTQIVDQLLTSVFQPASVFGAPVRGRVVLTFSGISVRG